VDCFVVRVRAVERGSETGESRPGHHKE